MHNYIQYYTIYDSIHVQYTPSNIYHNMHGDVTCDILYITLQGIASNDNVKRKKFGNASIIISAVSTTLWVILFVAIPIITGVAVAVSASSSRR